MVEWRGIIYISDCMTIETNEQGVLTPESRAALNVLRTDLSKLTPEQKKNRTSELIKDKKEAERKIILKEIRRAEFFALKNSSDSKDKKAQEILSKRSSFEDIKIADIVSLKKAGVPLYRELLINKSDASREVSEADLKVNSEFEVNF